VWDTRTGRLLRTLGDEPRVYAGAFAPDGEHFATGGEEGVIRTWDVKTGHRIQQLPPQGGRVDALAYDRSGTSLAAAIRGNRAFVWRLDAPGTPLRLSQPDNVVDIAFSPGGTLVVTSSDTGAARVWDRSSGRRLLTLPPRAGGNAAGRFTADGRSVMVSGVPELATVVSTYPCDECRAPGELVALARSRTTRELSPSERRVYLHEP
jgi:WD40 repeat protein